MLKIILILSGFASLTTQAQSVSVEQDSFRVAHEVRLQGPNLSPQQRTKIASHLQAIRDTLNSTNSNIAYLCVSRDNDGRNPYAIGFRNGSEIKKVNGTTFNNAASCQLSLDFAKVVQDGILVCITRDGDGRNPWQLGLLDQLGGMQKVTQSNTDTQETCLNLLK
jgi:hypothetical protein